MNHHILLVKEKAGNYEELIGKNKLSFEPLIDDRSVNM